MILLCPHILPCGQFAPARRGVFIPVHESAQAGGADNSHTHSEALNRVLGSEVAGSPVLPTPGRFAGLENREEVIAKPSTFFVASVMQKIFAQNARPTQTNLVGGGW